MRLATTIAAKRALIGSLGTIELEVPIRAKDGRITITTRPIEITPDHDRPDQIAFAEALRKSYLRLAQRERERRVPGDGLSIMLDAKGRTRRMRGTSACKGWLRADQMLADTPLHRHSKRCMSPTPYRPGWQTCKVAGTYTGQVQLHEHRTPRGRVFYVAHLPSIECKFDHKEVQS